MKMNRRIRRHLSTLALAGEALSRSAEVVAARKMGVTSDTLSGARASASFAWADFYAAAAASGWTRGDCDVAVEIALESAAPDGATIERFQESAERAHRADVARWSFQLEAEGRALGY